MAKLNVAIVGYGLAGSVFHAPLIATTDGLRVAAIVTNNPKRKREAKAAFPEASILIDPEQLWSNRHTCDLVVIATPNEHHAPLAMAAIDAGLPVVIDKPMAVTVKEANDLVLASQEKNVFLSVFQNRRWDNDFLTVRRLIGSDMLGQILRFESRFERYRPQPKENAWRESGDPAQAGGLLYDLGSHLIDQCVNLFGKPKEVYCEMNVRRPGAKADDDTFVALTYESGVIAHLWMSAVARMAAPRVRICGLKGTYEKYGLDPQEDALRAGRTPKDPDWGKEDPSKWGRIKSEIDGLAFDGQIETLPGAYQWYYSLVRDAILKNGAPPVEPGDALITMQIIEAALDSAMRKQPVLVY